MTEQEIQKLNLAGPCGFYCGTCSHYLARSKGQLKERKLKHGCKGCRVHDKRCAGIKRDCELIRKNTITFCFECKEFPCANLKKLDHRHIRDDQVSVIDNLHRIKKIGPSKWLKEQEAKWTCLKCGGNVCVINGECYDCGDKSI